MISKAFICSTFFLCFGSLYSDVIDDLTKSAKLLFEDSFDRDEKDDSREELGKNWVTNSAKRAKGDKQADLTGSSLMITMSPKADHGVDRKSVV